MSMTFPEWVRVHREWLGEGVGEFARKAGLPRTAEAKLGVNPQLTTISDFGRAAGLSAWEVLFLMERGDPENYHPEEL